MFFLRNHKPFLSAEETEQILACIRENEHSTSGEIRLFIESKCPYMNPLDRVRELFHKLKMYETTDRNGILIYIAYKDKDFALFGDKSICDKIEANFWQVESKQLASYFSRQDYANGILGCIQQVGKQLNHFFPWEGANKNELPDEIVFGK